MNISLTYSQHFDQFFDSLPRLIATLLYGDKSIYLEGSLTGTSCPFRKITNCSLPTRTCDFATVELDWLLKQKVVGYLHSRLVTIAPVGTSCPAVKWNSRQKVKLSSSIGWQFSPSSLYNPSSTVRTRQQGRHFHCSSSLSALVLCASLVLLLW